GATKIQTPALAGIAFREQTLNSDAEQQSKAIETTVLAEDGQRCLMASVVNGNIFYQFSQRSDDKSPGHWQRDPEQTLDWPADLPLASDVRLQAYLSRNGSIAVITVTSPLVKNTHLFTYQASEGKFQSRGAYAEVSSATLHPEGDYFGVANKSPTSTKAHQADVSSQLTVWETHSWLKKLELMRVDGTISALAFSPKQNVASTSNRGPVSQASTQVAAAIVGPDSKLSVVQWSVENGPRSGSKENFVKDIAPTDEPVGVVLMSPKTIASESAVIMTYCPNRTPALFISQGVESWVIRTDTKKSDSQEFASYPVAQSRSITAAAFSPDGTMLTTGSRDGKLALWFLSAESPQPVSLELTGHSWHSEQVFGVAFSPDSKYLVSGSRDKRMLVYDIHARYIVAAPILHSNTINQVAVTPDGRFAATMAKNVVYNWHMPQIGKLPLSLGVLSGRTIDANIVTTGNMLAAGGQRTEAALERGWVRVWDLERVLTKPEIPLPKPVVHLSMHASGKWLCAIDRQGHRHMVDDTGKRLWFESKIEGEGLESGIGRFSQFAPDDKFIKLLIASPSSSPTNDDQTVLRVLEWNAGNLSTSSSPSKVAINQTIRGTIAGAQFAPDSSRFVAYTTQGGVFVGDLKTEKIVELTRDGRAGSSGKNQAHRERITLAAFSPDGLRVVSGSEDDRAFIWSLDDGQWRVFPLEVRETDTIAPNTANINYVAFSATGQKVVTASADGRGIVWKLNQPQLRFEPHFSIKVLGTSQGMVQAEFIESPLTGPNAVDSERYLFCRWGDDTIRVFDTLIVNNPLRTDEPLFNGREVASLAAPYHIRKARLNLTADGSWQITAIGHESSGEPGTLGSQGICELSDTLGWSSQLKISNWLLRPLESNLAEPESSKRLKSIASVISARRLVGALQPMENLPSQKVLNAWKSVADPHLLFEQPDLDQIVAWHLDEADSSLLARPPQPTAALWHWRQVQLLKPEKLTDNIQLRRVAALAMTGQWEEAEDLLGNTSGQLASDVDFLSLRAALRLKQACVPKIDPLRKKLLEDQAIGDYQTILTRVPEDQAARGRLATLFLRKGADADAFRELDILVESAGATVEPELLQNRTSVRTRLGHESREIYRDFKRTASLFFAQNKLDAAVGQLSGALAMAKTKDGTLQPGIPTQEVAELYEMLADVYRQRKAVKQTQRNENGREATLAFLQAIKYAPDNMQLLHKFLFGVSDSDLPKGPEAWIEIDDLFKRAMRLDPDNEALALQRIATLIPQRDDDPQLDARLLQAISVYQLLDEKGWMNEERHLQMAALQVQIGDLPAAERSLIEAWEKLPDSTLIGLRLSLTQLAQHKPQEYKQTLTKLVQRSSSTAEGSDASNIAWAAAYAPDTLTDHPSVVQLARQAATASPDDPVAQSVLGAVLLRIGDKSAAVEELSSATLKRDSLTIQRLSAQQKLGGDAMDSLLTAMAQRDPQADEAFSLAKREIEKYRQQWPATEHFFDWIWNKLEFQVLEEEAQQLLDR
ncbi:MAG: hypothetical protein IT423_11660, partial [Pirellulaceae bacterium]|nr:hypothetical protein [Pirellulaceae bacterium]